MALEIYLSRVGAHRTLTAPYREPRGTRLLEPKRYIRWQLPHRTFWGTNLRSSSSPSVDIYFRKIHPMLPAHSFLKSTTGYVVGKGFMAQRNKCACCCAFFLRIAPICSTVEEVVAHCNGNSATLETKFDHGEASIMQASSRRPSDRTEQGSEASVGRNCASAALLGLNSTSV